MSWKSGPPGRLGFLPERGIGLGATGFVFLCILACDWGSGPGPVPATVEIWAGDAQTATVFTALSAPPSVRVLASGGKPVRGQEVVFSVASGNGRISGNVVETGPDGVAEVGTWILGTGVGEQRLQARVADLPPVFFSAMATPGSPAQMVIQEGNDQVGTVGEPLPENPAVLVKDLYGNPVPDVTVAFRVVGGGGFLAGGPAETDGEGVARAPAWTLGTRPGLNTLSASVPGVHPLTLRASADPGPPGRVTVLLGNGQTGTVATVLPERPTLLVADAFGNPLEGIPVTFEVTSGGGTIMDGQQVSGSSGAVVSGSWSLGPHAGVQTLGVDVPGMEPLTLSATALPGPPAGASSWGGEDQSATVATDVPDPPAVRVEDGFGNAVPGIAVVFSVLDGPMDAPAESHGSGWEEEVVTDADGVAAVERWTLGHVAGRYRMAAQVAGLPETLIFEATAVPDVPSAVSILAGDGQSARFETPVSVPPTIRVSDQHGNGVPDVPVGFEVLEGGGALIDPPSRTGPEGTAAPGSWVLGPQPGLNRISASAPGIGSVVFVAEGLRALPASIVATAGAEQEARVGTPVPVPPRVRVTDEAGDPVPSVPVSFVVTSGGGWVSGETGLTDDAGFAEAEDWILGTIAGPNTLSAVVDDLPPVVFSATALAGPPAAMERVQGNGQDVLAGTWVPVSPAVRLRDTHGNPVSGALVGFFVEAGGGTVTGGAASTDGDGVARAGTWTLGAAPGGNLLRAEAVGVPGVVFEATGWPAGGFQVELELMTPVAPFEMAALQAAALRWEEIVVGDFPDFSGTLPAGGCQPVEESEGIDDLKIYVTLKAIDGSGGVLGRAGPCYYRTNGGIYPLTGIMELDEADVADLAASGSLEDVIVHEMGHVLGFGTLWNVSTNDFLVGAGGVDPFFDGLAAITAFNVLGGAIRTGQKVPVENAGGIGTRDAHWRESVHNSELMTGWIEGGGAPNPLSAITIASLADMGFVVNMTAADPYSIFNPLGVPGQTPPGRRIELKELSPPTPIPVAPGGGLPPP